MDGSRMTTIYLSLPGVITVALRYDSKHFYWVMTDASVTLGVLELAMGIISIGFRLYFLPDSEHKHLDIDFVA